MLYDRKIQKYSCLLGWFTFINYKVVVHIVDYIRFTISICVAGAAQAGTVINVPMGSSQILAISFPLDWM